MAASIRITTVVREDGTIEIRAPGLVPGQQVTVSVEPSEQTNGEPAADVPVQKKHAAEWLAEMHEQREPRAARRGGPHLLDIVDALQGHRIFKTAEEVDAYIREERDSWDR